MRFAHCMTLTLPNTSLMGPHTNGPMANASKKIDMTRNCSISDRISNSSAIVSSAGATMVDAIGAINANMAIRMVDAHRRCLGQLCGFSGSSGPSHVTRFVSFTDRRLGECLSFEIRVGVRLTDGSDRHCCFDSVGGPNEFVYVRGSWLYEVGISQGPT